MLTEMAAMSIEDGMVMQIHPGSFRNHNAGLFASHGRDKGADIPTRTDYVRALKPLLDRFGTSTDLSIISSRWTRAPMRANSRRSPAIIRA